MSGRKWVRFRRRLVAAVVGPAVAFLGKEADSHRLAHRMPRATTATPEPTAPPPRPPAA